MFGRQNSNCHMKGQNSHDNGTETNMAGGQNSFFHMKGTSPCDNRFVTRYQRENQVQSIFQMEFSNILNMSSIEAMAHVDVREEIRKQFSVEEMEFVHQTWNLELIDLRILDKIYLQTRYIPYYKHIAGQHTNVDDSENGMSCESGMASNEHTQVKSFEIVYDTSTYSNNSSSQRNAKSDSERSSSSDKSCSQQGSEAVNDRSTYSKKSCSQQNPRSDFDKSAYSNKSCSQQSSKAVNDRSTYSKKSCSQQNSMSDFDKSAYSNDLCSQQSSKAVNDRSAYSNNSCSQQNAKSDFDKSAYSNNSCSQRNAKSDSDRSAYANNSCSQPNIEPEGTQMTDNLAKIFEYHAQKKPTQIRAPNITSNVSDLSSRYINQSKVSDRHSAHKHDFKASQVLTTHKQPHISESTTVHENQAKDSVLITAQNKQPKITTSHNKQPNISESPTKEENELIFHVVFGDSLSNDETVVTEFGLYYAFNSSDKIILNKIHNLLTEKFTNNCLVPCSLEDETKTVVNVRGKWFRVLLVLFQHPCSVVRLIDIGRHVSLSNNVCYKLPTDSLLSKQKPLAFEIKAHDPVKPGLIARVKRVNNNIPVEVVVLDEVGMEEEFQNGISQLYSEIPKLFVNSDRQLANGMSKLEDNFAKDENYEDRTYKGKLISSSSIEMNKSYCAHVVDRIADFLILSLSSGVQSKPHNYNNIDLLVRTDDAHDIEFVAIKEGDYVLVLDDKTRRWHRGLLTNKRNSLFYLIDTGYYSTSQRVKHLPNNMLDMSPAVIKIQINPPLLKFCDMKDTIQVLPLSKMNEIISAQLLLAPKFGIESPPPLLLGKKVTVHFATVDFIHSSVAYFFVNLSEVPSTLYKIHSLIEKSTKKVINVQVGDYCGISQEETNIFCRAKVLEVKGEQVTVFMIDYGEIEIVETSMCWQLPAMVYAYPPCIVKTKPLNSVADWEANIEVTLVPQEEIAWGVYSVTAQKK